MKRRYEGFVLNSHLARMACALWLVCVLVTVPLSAQQSEDSKLLASDGSGNHYFGTCTEVFGDIAMVGAVGYPGNGEMRGAVYVYRYEEATDTWNETHKLVASDGGEGDRFGQAVSLQGDLALIGAYGHNGYMGAAYMFRYDSGTDTWVEKAKLVGSDVSGDANFGQNVALHGDVALVGARYVDGNGAAYVFRYDSGSGVWNEEAKLTASDGNLYDLFGSAIALHHEVALIGAYACDFPEDSAGAAYVFRYDAGTQTWSEEAKLLASDGDLYDHLGYCVRLEQDMAMISAPGDENASGDSWAGSVYIFRHDAGTGTWTETSKISPADATEDMYFGNKLDLCGDIAVFGGNTETQDLTCWVYIYDAAMQTWEEQSRLHPSAGANAMGFGEDVAVSEKMALVGVPYSGDLGEGSGSALVYNLTWPRSVDIKANGFDDWALVQSEDNVNVTVSFKAGNPVGDPIDLWIVVYLATYDMWATYGNHVAPSWVGGASNVYYTGEMIEADVTVWDNPLTSGGVYYFIAAADDNPNGSLAASNILEHDVVTVLVIP